MVREIEGFDVIWIVTDRDGLCVVTIGASREPLPDHQWRRILDGADLAATIRGVLGVRRGFWMDVETYGALSLEERTAFALGRLTVIAMDRGAKVYRPETGAFEQVDGMDEQSDAWIVSGDEARALVMEAVQSSTMRPAEADRLADEFVTGLRRKATRYPAALGGNHRANGLCG